MDSLALLQFEGHDITIYGTQTDPLIKCTDLLIHVLGYKDCKTAKWFRKMVDNSNFVQPADLAGQRFFTEIGVYKALMKSNKPIAKMTLGWDTYTAIQLIYSYFFWRLNMQAFIEQQIQEAQLDVPQSFVQRFCRNYENKDIWMQSDVLYEWFGNTHNKHYKSFTKEIERQLIIDIEYKRQQNVNLSNVGGRGNKKILLVSQTGIKLMAMVADGQTRRYFTQLEQFAYKLIEHQKLIQHQQQEQLQIQSQQQLEETKQQLEEAKTEIEELKKPHYATVYKIKLGDRLLYVGKDTSKIQNRPQQHFTERRKIISNHQPIDIFLATMPEQDIKIELLECLDYEAAQIEKDIIQNDEPEWNQAMSDKRYKCNYSECQREFKMRMPFEKHVRKHMRMSSDTS